VAPASQSLLFDAVPAVAALIAAFLLKPATGQRSVDFNAWCENR